MLGGIGFLPLGADAGPSGGLQLLEKMPAANPPAVATRSSKRKAAQQSSRGTASNSSGEAKRRKVDGAKGKGAKDTSRLQNRVKELESQIKKLQRDLRSQVTGPVRSTDLHSR